jgi:hypothetical protein
LAHASVKTPGWATFKARRFAMTKLPPAFKRIRLNLARSKEFPSGSTRHGYEFVAPLDAAGHIDPAQWHKHRENCRVRRFWNGEEEHGQLAHKPGGAEHARWVFDYGNSGETDEEAGYRFGSHVFRLGEYVTIGDEHRELHTFRVVSVDTAT